MPLAHEFGLGSRCLRCSTQCETGLSLHYWRKICKNCKCSMDDHDVTSQSKVVELPAVRRVLLDDWKNASFKRQSGRAKYTANHTVPSIKVSQLNLSTPKPTMSFNCVSPSSSMTSLRSGHMVALSKSAVSISSKSSGYMTSSSHVTSSRSGSNTNLSSGKVLGGCNLTATSSPNVSAISLNKSAGIKGAKSTSCLQSSILKEKSVNVSGFKPMFTSTMSTKFDTSRAQKTPATMLQKSRTPNQSSHMYMNISGASSRSNQAGNELSRSAPPSPTVVPLITISPITSKSSCDLSASVAKAKSFSKTPSPVEKKRTNSSRHYVNTSISFGPIDDREWHSVAGNKSAMDDSGISVRSNDSTMYADPNVSLSKSLHYAELVDQYAKSLPADKLPILILDESSRSPNTTRVNRTSYHQRMSRQFPQHDFDHEFCDQLTKIEKEEMEKYVKKMRSSAFGMGTLITIESHMVKSKLCCRQCKHFFSQSEMAVRADRAGSAAFWHTACFKCQSCEELLMDLLYCQRKSAVYCARHYAEKEGMVRCYGCDELVFDRQHTLTEGRTWHVKHFCCYRCDTPLGGQHYIMKDQPYCMDCYNNHVAKTCCVCHQKIAHHQERVGYDQWSYHNDPHCMRCATCRKSLVGLKFVAVDGRVFCSSQCKRAYK